jgi:hypothetical protein
MTMQRGLRVTFGRQEMNDPRRQLELLKSLLKVRLRGAMAAAASRAPVHSLLGVSWSSHVGDRESEPAGQGAEQLHHMLLRRRISTGRAGRIRTKCVACAKL